MPTPEELASRFGALLREKYCIEPLPEFSIVVEVATDRDYMLHAVNLAREIYGEDLLDVPTHLAESGSRIAIVTPIDPALRDGKGRERGGIKRMAPLAKDLHDYVFFLKYLRGVVFVFDHDDAGLEAKKKLEALGYAAEQHIVTLEARHHPGACGKKQVVIEDLLSFQIQAEFFERGGAWCSVDYEAGEPKRFHWGHESKHLLRDYVCERAKWADVQEIGRAIARVRNVFGLPVNSSLFEDA
jgi:hypothetical protein